jgi:hypothetical protein
MHAAQRSLFPDEEQAWLAVRQRLAQRFVTAEETPTKLLLRAEEQRLRVDLLLRLDAAWLLLRLPVAREGEVDLRHAVVQTSQLELASISLCDGELALGMAVPLLFSPPRLDLIIEVCLVAVKQLRAETADCDALARALYRHLFR